MHVLNATDINRQVERYKLGVAGARIGTRGWIALMYFAKPPRDIEVARLD